jgi:hypothetical protein
MRACKHFVVFEGDETDIIQSDGFPWNAWIIVWEGDKRIYSSFQTGLFWNFLEHLKEHRECRKEVGITKKIVLKLLREIQREWNKLC